MWTLPIEIHFGPYVKCGLHSTDFHETLNHSIKFCSHLTAFHTHWKTHKDLLTPLSKVRLPLRRLSRSTAIRRFSLISPKKYWRSRLKRPNKNTAVTAPIFTEPIFVPRRFAENPRFEFHEKPTNELATDTSQTDAVSTKGVLSTSHRTPAVTVPKPTTSFPVPLGSRTLRDVRDLTRRIQTLNIIIFLPPPPSLLLLSPTIPLVAFNGSVDWVVLCSIDANLNKWGKNFANVR